MYNLFIVFASCMTCPSQFENIFKFHGVLRMVKGSCRNVSLSVSHCFNAKCSISFYVVPIQSTIMFQTYNCINELVLAEGNSSSTLQKEPSNNHECKFP